MPGDLDPTRLDALARAVEQMTRPLALTVVVQLDGNVRIDDAIEDAPFASMRQGPAEQKANAAAIVALVTLAPALLTAAREREELQRRIGSLETAQESRAIALRISLANEHTLRTQLTALTTERDALREALRLMTDKEHPCVTGDCPHGRGYECFEALRAEARTLLGPE